MTEFAIVLLVVVLIAAAVYFIVRSRGSGTAAVTAPPGAAEQMEVVLPVDDADPDSPATQRLVAEAADRALTSHPELESVVVVSRGGRELGRLDRQRAAERPFVDVPAALREPRAPRHHGPGEPVESEPPVHAPANVRFQETPSLQHRTLADRYELPERVRGRIGNPEDPVEIVHAIVEESAQPISVAGNVFRSGDRALIVLHTPLHATVDAATMNAAFLAFQSSGAKRGVVLTAGAFHVQDLRRRQALAPNLLHAGPDGIQRMADAVEMGANPLDFVVWSA